MTAMLVLALQQGSANIHTSSRVEDMHVLSVGAGYTDAMQHINSQTTAMIPGPTCLSATHVDGSVAQIHML